MYLNRSEVKFVGLTFKERDFMFPDGEQGVGAPCPLNFQGDLCSAGKSAYFNFDETSPLFFTHIVSFS